LSSIKITAEEFKKLEKLSNSSNRSLYTIPILYVVPILLVSIIPVKFLPRKLWNSTSNQFNDETLISLIGAKYFIIFLALWTIIMGVAGIAQFKFFGLKKDLKHRTKLRLTAEVSRVDQYDGVHYARLKGNKKVNILHFDNDNYVQLFVGQKIEFEIYEYSKKLIKIISFA